MTDLLHFAEHRLQEIALLFMACVYVLRVRWLLGYKAGRERQPRTGSPSTSARRGFLYSWALIAMPWAMESTRRHTFLYAQFVVFHLGVAAAITLSFIIPYWPGALSPLAASASQALTGAACAVGVMRLVRRIRVRHMRAISSPDDYFSLALLTVWLFTATLAASATPAEGERILLAFFVLTAFFLVYVPFSKISHYLYYPFTRFYLGRSMGHRGVFPLPRRVPAATAPGEAPARVDAPVSA